MKSLTSYKYQGSQDWLYLLDICHTSVDAKLFLVLHLLVSTMQTLMMKRKMFVLVMMMMMMMECCQARSGDDGERLNSHQVCWLGLDNNT